MARGGVILPEHLPAPRAPEEVGAGGTLQQAVRAWTVAQLAADPESRDLYERCMSEVEPPLFHAVLDRVLQNRTAAAELLGIHRATLRKRIG